MSAPGPFDELAEYRAHLTKPAEGEVLVQEDKDKSAAWRIGSLTSSRRIPSTGAVLAPRWGGVSALYHRLHRELLPRRFAYMASAHRWAGFGLNYMYMNLKAKCFTHRQGRTCEKPGHSCLRKVVSWRSHPAVDYVLPLAGTGCPDAGRRLGQGTRRLLPQDGGGGAAQEGRGALWPGWRRRARGGPAPPWRRPLRQVWCVHAQPCRSGRRRGPDV